MRCSLPLFVTMAAQFGTSGLLILGCAKFFLGIVLSIRTIDFYSPWHKPTQSVVLSWASIRSRHLSEYWKIQTAEDPQNTALLSANMSAEISSLSSLRYTTRHGILQADAIDMVNGTQHLKVWKFQVHRLGR
jgi:hypothetical protein